MQGFVFQTLGGLLLAAVLVAIVSHRLRLPYSVGLVLAGAGLAVVAPGSMPPLTRDLIFLVFLPPLVFEAAVQIPWAPLRREMPLLLLLVTVGVVLAAGVVAGGMHWLAGWSWIGAGLFGMLIAATDPVSVIAAFKQLKVEPRLHLLVEAESLLNDGTAAVGFVVLAAIATGGSAAAPDVALALLRTVGVGIGCGLGVALVLVQVARRSEDRLVEVALTVLVAYGSFLIAEHFGGSGVLATLSAGLVVGNYGFMRHITDSGRQGVLGYWEFVAFLINSAIFLLIGGQGATIHVTEVLAAAMLATGLSLGGRAIAVYPIAAAFAGTRLALSWAYRHVLFWGGRACR